MMKSRFYIVCPFVLATLMICFGGKTAPAVTTGSEFTRYQIILDRKPFGEVTPSEASPTQEALGVAISRDLEMKAIIDDGTGIRIGLLDKKTNKNFSLGVGENHDGLTLVSVNYENEEAVVKKGAETAVVKLRPDKDKDKATAAGAAPALALEAAGSSPFQAPNPFAAAQSSTAPRKPFFSDLKKRRLAPFSPAGTNAFPFQAKPLDSFFKPGTGALTQASSPFSPFKIPEGGAKVNTLQQFIRAGSNAPAPFTPITPPNPNLQTDGKGSTIEQLLQGQPEDQNPAQTDETQFPAEETAP